MVVLILKFSLISVLYFDFIFLSDLIARINTINIIQLTGFVKIWKVKYNANIIVLPIGPASIGPKNPVVNKKIRIKKKI